MAQAQDDSDKVIFYYNEVCPFAHRAWLTLTLKEIPYEGKRCSLEKDKKEDYFKAAYEKAFFRDELNEGKVPIVFHNNHYITESAAVARYLDIAFPKHKPNLVPYDNAFNLATTEIMIDWLGSNIVAPFYKILASKDNEIDQNVNVFKQNLKYLNNRMLKMNNDGPFFLGENVSLFDVAAWPWFERFVVLEKLCGLSWDDVSKGCDRVQDWVKAMKNHDAVKKIAQDPQIFIKGYANYRPKA